MLKRAGGKHLDETGLVGGKLDKIDQGIAAGNRKLLNADEALGEYAKHAK